MKKIYLLIFIILNINLIMKAQKEVMRDPTNPIRLTDKLSIYQEEIIENDNLYWKLYLNKEGEKEPKLLDKDETLAFKVSSFNLTSEISPSNTEFCIQ